MFKYEKFIIGIIVVLAFLLRVVWINSTPPSLSHDEVAIGYNAWSILQTGKDEYGTKFPVLFQSFDDYKLPGYIYMTALSEAVFGLTSIAVRLPSVILGTFSVLLLYFLLREVFKKDDKFAFVPLLASFLLAISPWSVNFSRAAFESNGSVFFLLAGTLFLLKSSKQYKYIALSALFFALSIYFYYTARIVIPAILLVHLVTQRSEIMKFKQKAVVFTMSFVIFLLPILPNMFSSGLSRVNQVSIFESREVTANYRDMQERKNDDLGSKLLYNDKIAYGMQFVDNYLKNFNHDFYFTTGTGPMGLLYLWELPFFYIGIISLLLFKNKSKWILFAWFLSVPVVGGLTMNQPNALRTLPNAAITPVFSALGIISAFGWFKAKHLAKPFSLVLGIIILAFFVRFLSLYFDYYPQKSASMWGDGHKAMAEYVNTTKGQYKKVYVSGEYWRPYVYYLYYSGYAPSDYQGKWNKGEIENIKFGKAKWDSGDGLVLETLNLSTLVEDKTLFLLTPEEFKVQQQMKSDGKVPYTLIVKKEINGRFVSPAFYAVVLE